MLWLPPNYRELRIPIAKRYVSQLEAYIDQGCLVITYQGKSVGNVVDITVNTDVWLTVVEARNEFFSKHNVHLESYILDYTVDKDTDKLLSVLTLKEIQ